MALSSRFARLALRWRACVAPCTSSGGAARFSRGMRPSMTSHIGASAAARGAWVRQMSSHGVYDDTDASARSEVEDDDEYEEYIEYIEEEVDEEGGAEEDAGVDRDAAATPPHAQAQLSSFLPRVAVVGVGGAGGNAVNHMIASGMDGVDFLVCNTDSQALSQSLTPNRVQLGRELTKGLGAGSKPEVGRAATEAHVEEVMSYLSNAHLVFVAAGMGGGTGTGASPVITAALKEAGILSVAVVSQPFNFEGAVRSRSAAGGLRELEKVADTIIVTHNQLLVKMASERGNFSLVNAFKECDEVLHCGVRTISDLIVKPGLINLDFSDVRTVLQSSRQHGYMGRALMGTGEASGADRASVAAKAATENPLLGDVSLDNAMGLLINIAGGKDLTMGEVEQAASYVQSRAHDDADIVWGAHQHAGLDGKVRVSIVATGLEVD